MISLGGLDTLLLLLGGGKGKRARRKGRSRRFIRRSTRSTHFRRPGLATRIQQQEVRRSVACLLEGSDWSAESWGCWTDEESRGTGQVHPAPVHSEVAQRDT